MNRTQLLSVLFVCLAGPLGAAWLFLIAAEAIYLLVCAFVLLAALAFAAQMVVEKKFVRLIWVVLSVAVFLYSLGIGFNYGAAILYAT